MAIPTTHHESTPAILAALLVDQIRDGRLLQLELALAHEQREALREALAVATGVIAARDREVARARAALRALRGEPRQVVAAQRHGAGHHHMPVAP